MESMIVASFSVAETALRVRKVATPKASRRLASFGPTPLPLKPAIPPSLAACAYVDLGHAVGITGETHFLARQFCPLRLGACTLPRAGPFTPILWRWASRCGRCRQMTRDNARPSD